MNVFIELHLFNTAAGGHSRKGRRVYVYFDDIADVEDVVVPPGLLDTEKGYHTDIYRPTRKETVRYWESYETVKRLLADAAQRVQTGLFGPPTLTEDSEE